jgi:hypothetical protein
VHKAQALSKELTDAISEAIALRVKACELEKNAHGIETNSQTRSKVDQAKAEELKAEAKRHRAEAVITEVNYRRLYAEIFELKEEIHVYLLPFDEDGKRISESIENIGFSSWSSARGWQSPLRKLDEEGVLLGMPKLGKILSAAVDMLIPRRNKPDHVAERRKKAILELCEKYYRKTRNYIRAVCEGLQKKRIHMPEHWVKEWNGKHSWGLEVWDWLIAYRKPQAKHRIENCISRLNRLRLRSSTN